MKSYAFIFVLFTKILIAQDTLTYQWPVTPFNSTQLITGSFCEYRNTLSSNHFHNGADVPKDDGTAVYPVLDGVITAIGYPATEGTSAYIRVEGTVSGIFKSMAYVHIEPNPALSIGQSVTKGVTVLGNILSGMGHTHLIDGRFNSENNALRKVGGLFPFVDTYSPKVLWVKFFQDNSNVEFTTKKVFGLVDIVSQMVERNSSDAPNSGSTTNNGVYHTGFKIYSADKSTVLYNPPGNGVRFKFDWKPNDANANVVYTTSSDVSNHIYYLTNGSGNIGATKLQSVGNNYFNTTLLPPGQYQAMVYAIDTRGNADTVFTPFEISTQDVVAPAPPFLKSVLNDSTKRITISWYPNSEPDLQGYRLYSTVNGTLWSLQKDESVITRNQSQYSFNGITSQTPVYFKLTAVDSAAITNESGASDIYGLRPNTTGKNVLVIDAFDRISGRYKLLSHPFAMTCGQSILTGFETAHDKAIVDGIVPLSKYDAVVWNFGDESSTDETFGEAEQTKAISYLQQGGRIFANGSEIAYDLDRPSGPSQADRDFIHTYFKTGYGGHVVGNHSIKGWPVGGPNGVVYSYGDTVQGSPYSVDSSNHITWISGISYGAALYCNSSYTAAVSDYSNKTVLLGIPFETIHTKVNRDLLMAKVMGSFGIEASVQIQSLQNTPTEFSLSQNFPNPFNPTTTIQYGIPIASTVTVKIYDILGKEVLTLVDQFQQAGSYSLQFNGLHLSSGMYFYTLRTNDFSATKKLVLTK